MNGKIALSVLGFIVAGAVGAYGVISLLADTNIIKPSKMAIESASLHVQVEAVADWATSNNTFSTETSSEGFMQDEWENMPNIEFSDTMTTATLTINIANLSNSTAKLEIRGIGYDSEILDVNNYRFTSVVELWDVGTELIVSSTTINSDTPIYRLNNIAAGESVMLKIVYELVAENMPISVNNNITMAFNIVSPGE